MHSKNILPLFNKIVQKDWIQLHPLKLQSPSDYYFIQLSNKILLLLDKDKNAIVFSSRLKRLFAITAVSYFEDVISNIGLWKAFRQIHFEKCGKMLPFLHIREEYSMDEINLEDIQFLIWSIIQRDVLEQDELKFINIENPIITLVSLLVYEVLDAEYETAPENEVVHNAVHSANLASDYYLFREFLKWLHYDSYLSCPYPKNKLQYELERSKNNKFVKENKDVLSYTLVNSLIFTEPCSPIAIIAYKWFEYIVSDNKVKEFVHALEYKTFETYKIVGVNEKSLKIKLFDRGTDVFELDLNSLNSTADIKNKKAISCAMTFFNGLWNVNGMASFNDEEDISTDSTDPESIVNSENNKMTYDFVLKNNKDRSIAYFKDTNELSDFLLKLFPDSTKNDLNLSNIKSDKNIVVFTHPNLGLVMYSDLAKWIKDKNNPCYNKQSASDHSVSIFCGGYNCQREFIEYLIQKNLIPDARINSLEGEEYGRKMVQDNLDFIVRFFQPELFST
jgi:hypothetical protein